MKKIVLLILGVMFITGCSGKKEQELCTKIDEIDVFSYTSVENYDELSTVLKEKYDNYCTNMNSKVCDKLNEFITLTNKEIKFEDCNTKEGTWKELCESNNKLAISGKKSQLNYTKEEIYSICSEL